MIRRLILAAVAAATFGTVAFAAPQQSVTAGPYMVQLPANHGSLVAGKPVSLDPIVMDAKTMAPSSGLKIVASPVMPEMPSMAMDKPTVEAGKVDGHYLVGLQLPHEGSYRLDLILQPTGPKVSLSLVASQGMLHQGHGGMEHGVHLMTGMLGDWPASREGSGTSWQPDDSPMFMKMLPKAGRYDLNLMGQIQAGYVDAGGKRGDEQAFANSMAMWMAQRDTGGGRLGLRLMLSLDPVTNGKRGVPNLFQTGETLHGRPLVDRQHPHDFLSEAAVSFSKPLGRDLRGFIYGGPVGEPALGNSMFLHRASGMEIPEAPITHHWFDSTHIAFGVATAGLTSGDKWKAEASAFNGHEPGENRFDIDPIQLNSGSTRFTYNPDSHWSLSASYGFLESPEALEPGVDQHRATASVQHGRTLANGDNWSTSLLWGRIVRAGHRDSDAVVLESTYYHGTNSTFARFERVDKDELVGVPEGRYGITKLVLGHTHGLSSRDGYDLGLGAYVGLYAFPRALEPFYGRRPVTWGLFLRLRPSKM